MNKIFRKEVLIGLLVIVAMAILFFGINFLKGINIFKTSNYFYARYTQVEGLDTSAPITLNGYKVGLVRDVVYDYANPGNVTVELSLDKDLRLPVGSVAAIESSLLGTASIVLTLGNPADGFYNVGDTIPGQTKAGMLQAVSEQVMPSLGAIFGKIDSLLTSLNGIAANPSLTKSLNRLDGITGDLEATIHSLRGVMAKLDPIARNVNGITSNVDTITRNLTVVSDKLRQAEIDSIMNDLQATASHLATLTRALNNPNSTVGKLTNDPELYNNLNNTVNSLDSLLVDIKKNPKRYISIKVF